MGFFRKREVIDWTETYKPDKPLKREEDLDLGKLNSSPVQSSQEQSSGMGFFGGFFGGDSTSSSAMNNSGSNSDNLSVSDSEDSLSPEERKRRFAKRLSDMTERIEDLSNQIYHLQNRIEVLEKKLGTNSFGY